MDVDLERGRCARACRAGCLLAPYDRKPGHHHRAQIPPRKRGGRSGPIDLRTERYSNTTLQPDKGYERPSETMTSPPSAFAVARPSSLAPSSICLRHPSRSRLNCIAKEWLPSGSSRLVPSTVAESDYKFCLGSYLDTSQWFNPNAQSKFMIRSDMTRRPDENRPKSSVPTRPLICSQEKAGRGRSPFMSRNIPAFVTSTSPNATPDARASIKRSLRRSVTMKVLTASRRGSPSHTSNS
jgi:hypothetical protein